MYKQIIIARKDLNMSPGKLAAQVSHASMAFLTQMIRETSSRYINEDRHPSKEWRKDVDGKIYVRPFLYRRKDLTDWAKEAFEREEPFFYTKPVDPTNPYGKLELCDPTYTYKSTVKMDPDLYEQWINGIFTKCILGAKNINQLLKAKTMAEEMGMQEGKDFFLIKDRCLTELEPEEVDENGVGRTLTCIGFAPMDSEIIDKIGKKFQLYK